MSEELFKKVKNASRILSLSSLEERNEALSRIAQEVSQNRDFLLAANGLDLDDALKTGENDALIARLRYTEAKIEQSIRGLEEVRALPDPIFRVREKREIDSGFILEKVAIPLGVIGAVFEARPDAFLQIASLALKSGNGLVLKGGIEARNTNRALYEIIQKATESFSFSSSWIGILETRDDVKELLSAEDYCDLIIPRGSKKFVRYVMDNTHIPVLGHADGICITYVEKSADIASAVDILVDAKTNYPAACNATETILIDEDISSSLLPLLANAFEKNSVVVHADEKSILYFKNALPVREEDYDTEFLKKECALRIVSSFEEALSHIEKHSSKHTDAILTRDKNRADEFIRRIDSADVFVNCSTRFADGYRFGLGSEVGISTSRIHSRGPVGLEGLMTTKWILTGHGETVTEYLNGTKSFHFKEREV